MSQTIEVLCVENRINECISLCIKHANEEFDNVHLIDEIHSDDFEHFKKVYVHLSTNSKDFELICIRRYFLIADFLKNRPIDKFILIDSDLIVCRGLHNYAEEILSKFDFAASGLAFDLEFSNQLSPHCSFWTKDSLLSFVNFIKEIYSAENSTHRLRKINERFINNGVLGGISDMTLLYLWAVDTGRLTLNNLVSSHGVVDHNICLADNVERNDFDKFFGVKKIRKHKGDAFFYQNDKPVRVLCVHFQGKAKILMPSFSKMNLPQFYLLSAVLYLARKYKKLVYGWKVKIRSC